MCGITGYAGHRPAVPLLIEGLRRMEYRGYDSAGVAYVQNGALHVVRAQGKLAALEEKLAHTSNNSMSMTGIGHTRWATHGIPAERNAHPQVSNDGKLALVHNGIIENHQELRAVLLEKGYVFHSETDTEVLVNLIADECTRCADLLSAFAAALQQAHGAYAVALVSNADPRTVLAARLSSPLVVGLGTGECFVASDITAFLPYTRDVIFLEDAEIAQLDPQRCTVYRLDDMTVLRKDVHQIQWDMQAAQKGGYKHFMLKEIFEQPRVITDCLAGRIITPAGNPLHTADGQSTTAAAASGSTGFEAQVRLPELDALPIPRRLHIVACGTSFHAGMWARDLFEDWAELPISLDIASEFRYRHTILDPEDAVLVISQSGETADTLAALRLARAKGCRTIGLCNVIGSSIAREADAVIHTQAGPEISVASTKAMCSQMVVLLLMALYYGARKAATPPTPNEPNHAVDPGTADRVRMALTHLRSLPVQLESALPGLRETAQLLAREYSSVQSFFFLGRGQAFPLALEGALKLKEISYIHAEGYAAGEIKHGPIALIDPAFPTFAIALDDALFPKTKSNIAEIQARLGQVIALVNPGTELHVDNLWTIPSAWGPLGAFFALPAMQLFSYEMADYLGKDVDQPRNLAKSVTVE